MKSRTIGEAIVIHRQSEGRREPASINSLIRPRSVAVVGASANADKVGGRPISYLVSQGFKGSIFPINPKADSVQGVKAYPSLEALPEVPEVAILCIGGDQAAQQLEICARLGVKNAILFASGFSELGEDGRQKQDHLTRICREGGVRLLGPNTIGFAGFDNGAVLSFASVFSVHPPLDGPIAIISQSGGIGACAYALLREAGWGVRCVAATGNEADVDTADFVDAFAQAQSIKAMLLYIEDVKDVEKMSSALAAARAKDIAIIALRAGRSDEGKRTAALHTGSRGAATPEIDDIFTRHGCRTVDSLEQLVGGVPFYLGTPFLTPATSRRPRIALISNSGAGCVLAADQAVRAGLELSALSQSTRAELGTILPDFSRNRNPVDLTAALISDSSMLGKAVYSILADPEVDGAALGLLALAGSSYDVPRFAADAHAAADRTGKPLAVYSPHAHVRDEFSTRGHAVFRTEADALEALSGFFGHQAAIKDARQLA